ncbi:glycogen/starch/alpha-glucan phosphorylase, partial [Oliverpabstia sp. DFI.9.49]|nr:glycogen/starch/alpha-glucan phosphorylase [Oliverpabstia sp. DFI.9.49]
LDQYVAVHINDTHPSMAIAELMRLLMDEHGLGWEDAWKVTVNVMSYTNHTIMAEAMERWNISMMQQEVPRILQIIQEIDRRFVLS